MTRLTIFVLLALAVLLPSAAQAQVNVILSTESDAFPTNPNATLGTDTIGALTRRPDISTNGRYIGIEAGLQIGDPSPIGNPPTDDAAVVIDLQTNSRTVIGREDETTFPGIEIVNGEEVEVDVPIGSINDSVEVNNTGQAAFHAGDSITTFWDGTNLTQVVAEGDPSPAGAPLSEYGNQFSQVQLTNAGVVGGQYDSNGTGEAPSSRDNFLSLGSTILVAGNTSLPGYLVQDSNLSGATENFSEVNVSSEGTDWIAEIRFDDASGFDSTITVNGIVVAQEGLTTHTTPDGFPLVYDNTLDADIANGGQWITHSRSEDSIDYTLVNGIAVLAENELAPNGSTLTSMSGVSINSNGEYVSLWNTDGDEDNNAVVILFNDTTLLTKGDTLSVDYNGDGTLEDLVIRSFPTDAFNLADDGTLAMIVSLNDPAGTEVGNALVTLNINDFFGLIGDVNLDGIVNFLDIAPFISRLTTSDFQFEADIDGNGTVNFLDIAPFIGILTTNGS